MEIRQFKGAFSVENVPLWNCPSCLIGALLLVKDEFFFMWNAATIHVKDESAFSSDWVESVFHGRLQCKNCEESVVIAGQGYVEEEHIEAVDGSGYSTDYVENCLPRYFYPPLRLITIPASDKLPQKVKDLLLQSFELFWSAPDLCANRLRSSLEEILTDFGEPTHTEGPRIMRLNLHRRIEKISHPELIKIKNMLLAVKILGNAGSHELGGTTKDQVLDGYEILEHCLEIIYPVPKESRADRIQSLAEAINTKKGPLDPMERQKLQCKKIVARG